MACRTAPEADRGRRRAPRPALVCVLLATIVAGSSASPSSGSACPNEALRAGPSAGLPDCRGYELVSSEKQDADAMLSPLISEFHSNFPDYGLVADGSLLWDTGFVWPYGAPSNGVDNVHRAVRAAGECSSDSVTCWVQSTPVPRGAGARESPALVGASRDLSTVLLKASPIVYEPARETRLLERAPDGSYSTIANVASPAQVDGQLSPDGSRVLLQTEARLVSEDTHGPVTPGTNDPLTHQVYEWTRSGGLHLAGIDSHGNQTSPCGAALASGNRSMVYPSLSADGSRVFFQSPDPALNTGEPEECRRGPVVDGQRLYVSDLYLREGGGRTVEISKPPPGAADYGGQFVGASADGSKVFFVTETALTPDKATSGRGHADLYQYDLPTGRLIRLSVGPPGYDDADVTGFAGALSESAIVSADGSHVYFTALGQLVPGAGASAVENAGDATANLYRYSHGRVAYLATVAVGNFTGAAASFGLSNTSPLSLGLSGVTPDGSDLVFDSTSRLTSYANETAGEAVAELYRYDEPTGTISCVSCSTAGLPPNRVDEHGVAFHTSFWQSPKGSVEQFGGLSTDGQTVFFASTDRLLPGATNASAPTAGNPIYNVYEWHNGALSLISTGTSSSSDFLLGSSPGGSDVYILTADQLAAQDSDHAYDIYDARVGGGLRAPTAPAACASADTCRSTPATPPVPLPPNSATFTGEGNLAPLAEAPSQSSGQTRAKPRHPLCRARARTVRYVFRRGHALMRCPKRAGKAPKPRIQRP
jgi:Tol biopolymer transport system component